MRVESLDRRSTRESNQEKVDTYAPNVRKVANRCVFSMVRGSWCSKSSLAKAAGAEVAVQQTHEKWHAAVVRSTLVSQNMQNTSARDRFWKFSFGKGRRCGAKRVCKSKCAKHLREGLKNSQSRSTFWSSDVEKLHAAVARSTFLRQNLQNTCVLAHALLLDLPMWKRSGTEGL